MYIGHVMIHTTGDVNKDVHVHTLSLYFFLFLYSFIHPFFLSATIMFDLISGK